jgi:hypothetical protein
MSGYGDIGGYGRGRGGDRGRGNLRGRGDGNRGNFGGNSRADSSTTRSVSPDDRPGRRGQEPRRPHPDGRKGFIP